MRNDGVAIELGRNVQRVENTSTGSKEWETAPMRPSATLVLIGQPLKSALVFDRCGSTTAHKQYTMENLQFLVYFLLHG